MAEPVSSIITIATVSLAIIKETVKYIKEVRLVDRLVQDLLTELKELHRVIKVVESTYHGADPGQDSEPSVLVYRNLTKCKGRLEDVKLIVIELASRDTNTVFQKFALKRQSDAVKKDMERATKDIHRYMEYIRTGIQCWSLDVVTAHRRISEAMAAQQATAILADLPPLATRDVSQLGRTLSNADTLLVDDSTTPLRRLSTTTSQTSYSASSQALHTQSDDNESIVSSQSLASLKPNSDWIEFHFQITKCNVEEIKRTLQQHTEPSVLAKSADGSQRTPLHLAAQRGDVQLANILLDFGADINAKDSQPSSVLDLAVANKHIDFVAFLLERGVDETLIRVVNTTKFREMKQIISFKESVSKTAKKEHRKLSWSRSKGLAT